VPRRLVAKRRKRSERTDWHDLFVTLPMSLAPLQEQNAIEALKAQLDEPSSEEEEEAEEEEDSAVARLKEELRLKKERQSQRAQKKSEQKSSRKPTLKASNGKATSKASKGDNNDEDEGEAKDEDEDEDEDEDDDWSEKKSRQTFHNVSNRKRSRNEDHLEILELQMALRYQTKKFKSAKNKSTAALIHTLTFM
jgi:hypothetical protein